MDRMVSYFLRSVAVAAAVFHMYAAGVSPFTAMVHRPIHLAFMATLGFLGVGVQMVRSAGDREGRLSRIISWTLTFLTILSCVYLASQHEALVRRSGAPTTLDLVFAVVALVVVLELARRATGWGLVVVSGMALVYALLGPWLPGVLAHRGYTPGRILEHLYLSTEGIWGIPLGVSADFVYLFVLFGALLDRAGGGALLIALADRVAGRTRGGPAKTAAVASAFMGSLSGSAVANVVTTGTFTIPLMRSAGFKPAFAGAIEAAASTGGQLMPPVMGAGAFILATWTNIPYPRVAAAAVIPSVLFYLALLAAIHFRAGRMGLKVNPDRNREAVLNRLHLLLPLGIIVVFLGMGRSPMRAAFWGVMCTIALSFLRKETRLSPGPMVDALMKAASGAVQVAAACAAAGIVVGVASLTGIGLRMSGLIIDLSGGHLFPALLLTALGSIILGMGLPTTAAYVVLAALGAPALTELGVSLLGAHLFIFYFGCLSNVTPPVALGSYAAAGIAGSAPMQTSIYGAILSLPGFLIPFFFVYHPALILDGTTWEILSTLVTGSLGVGALAACTMGFAVRNLSVWERVLMGVAAIALISPDTVTDVAGLVLLAGLTGWLWSSRGVEVRVAPTAGV
jgi:TRAP transporter 4TM/12TM fusion protein